MAEMRSTAEAASRLSTAVDNDVGKRISISWGTKKQLLQATIIGKNHTTGKHVIRFDRDGREEAVALKIESFNWITQPCIAADSQKQQDLRKSRALNDLNRALVGRRFEYTTSKKKRKNFKILSYDRKTREHQVKNEKSNKIKCIDVTGLTNFKWLDVIKEQHRQANYLYSSRYIGVTNDGRQKSRWKASTTAKNGRIQKHIGTFTTEKDAALARDFYARKAGRNKLNFENESISEQQLIQRKIKKSNPSISGRSKFRGVHWQKNRKRWMARYSHNEKGKKHINLGAFLEARHAAFAFDHEARKQGRGRESLNFPDLTVTTEKIKSWSTNTAHYRYMRSGTSTLSQYRGVTIRNNRQTPWFVQVNIKKVVKGLCEEKGPVKIGSYSTEIQAALAFDRVCRKFGVEERGLNFPRNTPLREVRLFDISCYHCQKVIATDPVKTKCNHVFCRRCIMNYLSEVEGCPCCQTHMTVDDTGIQAVALNTLSTTVPTQRRNTEVVVVRNNNDNIGVDTNHDNNSDDVADREIEVIVVNDDASTDSLISIGEQMTPNGQDLNRRFQRSDSSIDSVKQDNNDCGNKSLSSILDDEDEDHPRNKIKKLRRRRRRRKQQQHRCTDDGNIIMKQQEDKTEKNRKLNFNGWETGNWCLLLPALKDDRKQQQHHRCDDDGNSMMNQQKDKTKQNRKPNFNGWKTGNWCWLLPALEDDTNINNGNSTKHDIESELVASVFGSEDEDPPKKKIKKLSGQRKQQRQGSDGVIFVKKEPKDEKERLRNNNYDDWVTGNWCWLQPSPSYGSNINNSSYDSCRFERKSHQPDFDNETKQPPKKRMKNLGGNGQRRQHGNGGVNCLKKELE